MVIYAVIYCLRAKEGNDRPQTTGACLLAEVLEVAIESQCELVYSCKGSNKRNSEWSVWLSLL